MHGPNPLCRPETLKVCCVKMHISLDNAGPLKAKNVSSPVITYMLEKLLNFFVMVMWKGAAKL